MSERIGEGLELIQLPRKSELGEYDWFDIELGGAQVGKSRCRIESNQATVYSIMIYPEYAHKGYARAVIDYFKTRYPLLYADRVRFNARDFWFKMGFLEEAESDHFVWRRVESRTAL
jgi:GNAT superfamily N-acetyltransferase